MAMLANRYVRSLQSRTEAAAVVAGLRPLRPRYEVASTKWDTEYSSGVLDYYDSQPQRARPL